MVAYALSFRYVQDQAMEELVQQAEYIASCDVTDGTELSIPDEKTIEQYQRLTNSMVLYVDRDYLATHIGASGEPAPGGPEFARLEIISSIDRQFVARTVSYTHLDVYKRQSRISIRANSGAAS